MVELVELFANIGDPDQKQPSAASNVGLHCVIYLSIYLLLSVHYLFFKRYELTKLGTSWLGRYELTRKRVRVDQK